MIFTGGRAPLRLLRALRRPPSSTSSARFFHHSAAPSSTTPHASSSSHTPFFSASFSPRAAPTSAGLSLRLRSVAPGSLRSLHSSGRATARLGKITPRRVAVINGEIVDGPPEPSVWRPVVVSAVDGAGREERGRMVKWDAGWCRDLEVQPGWFTPVTLVLLSSLRPCCCCTCTPSCARPFILIPLLLGAHPSPIASLGAQLTPVRRRPLTPRLRPRSALHKPRSEHLARPHGGR